MISETISFLKFQNNSEKTKKAIRLNLNVKKIGERVNFNIDEQYHLYANSVVFVKKAT